MTEEIQETEETQEAEAKAREKGWKPEAEWDGDPDKWAPADEFLKMKDRQLEKADLAAQKEIASLKRDLEKYTGRVSELQQTLKDFGEHHSKVEKRAYEKALKDIEAKMEKAVEDGDTATYRQLKGEAKDLQKDAAEATKKPETSADDIPAYKDWVQDNGWYNTDIRMRNYANRISEDVKQVTGLTGTDPGFYAAITEAVKEEFPSKFEKPKRSPTVEGAGSSVSQRSNGKGWKDIPAEDRKAVDHFFKNGLFEDSPKGRAQYAKEYWEDD